MPLLCLCEWCANRAVPGTETTTRNLHPSPGWVFGYATRRAHHDRAKHHSPRSSVNVREAGGAALRPPRGSGLGYSQLNRLLLLLGFDRVTHAFFQFLIDGTTDCTDGAAIGTFEQLEMGVDRFRSLGLLMFGKVKYAFKVLSRDAELLEQGRSACTSPGLSVRVNRSTSCTPGGSSPGDDVFGRYREPIMPASRRKRSTCRKCFLDLALLDDRRSALGRSESGMKPS